MYVCILVRCQISLLTFLEIVLALNNKGTIKNPCAMQKKEEKSEKKKKKKRKEKKITDEKIKRFKTDRNINQ